MVDKGKGIDKGRPSRSLDTTPVIDGMNEVGDCSSQRIEHVLDPTSAGPINIDPRDNDNEPYISPPTDPPPFMTSDSGEGSYRTVRKALDPEEMDNAVPSELRNFENRDCLGSDETRHVSGGSYKDRGVNRWGSVVIGDGSLDLSKVLNQNFFTASEDDHLVEDTARGSNEFSEYLEYFYSSSSTTEKWRPSTPQSVVTIVGVDPEDETNEDDQVFDAPLTRVPTNSPPIITSIGTGAPPVPGAGNSRPSYVSRLRSTRTRGNTYNPTILRRPHPVQPPSLERGWAPLRPQHTPSIPPRAAIPLDGDDNNDDSDSGDGDSGNNILENPGDSLLANLSAQPVRLHPSDMFPQSRSIVSPVGLETVVEEVEEDEDWESTVIESDSTPYPAPPPSLETVMEEEEDEDEEFTATESDSTPQVPLLTSLETVIEEEEDEVEGSTLTESDSTPYPASPSTNIGPQFACDSPSSHAATADTPVPTITPRPTQAAQPLQTPSVTTLAPISLPQIHLAPIIIAPISLDQALEDLSSIQATRVLLPERPAQRVFSRDPTFRSFKIDHGDIKQVLIEIPARHRRVAPHRGNTPKQTMEESIKRFRDSTNSIINFDIPVFVDDSCGGDSSSEDSESSKASGSPPGSKERKLKQIEPVGKKTLPSTRTTSDQGHIDKKTVKTPTFQDYPELVSEIIGRQQPSQSWSRAGDWSCKSCGWLSPKNRTECFHCHFVRVLSTPRADFLSVLGEPLTEEPLSEGPAQSLSTQSPEVPGSIEPQETSEQPQSLVGGLAESEDNEAGREGNERREIYDQGEKEDKRRASGPDR